MAMLQDDMSKVSAPNDLVEEGWYHVRISAVKTDVSVESSQPVLRLNLKVQNDGPMLGRVIQDNCSLQPHALFKLKGYYKAVGYEPGPEGHDPDRLLDTECYIYVEHGMYKGKANVNIPPYSIRSVQEGPGSSTPRKKESA